LIITGTSPTPLVGDEVEVLGFPMGSNQGPRLLHSQWKVLAHGPAPMPQALTSPIRLDREAQLVSHEGRVISGSGDSGMTRLQLEGLNLPCHVMAEVGGNTWPVVPEGSRVRVTGLCELNSPASLINSGRFPRSVSITARTPGDVEVLELPRLSAEVLWLRLGIAALSLALIALASFWWRSYRQSERAQRQREVTDSLLAERQRLSRELHDTLAQGLNTISLRLGAAAEQIPTRPERAAEHLESARQEVRASLSAARDAIDALRPSILNSMTLPQAIHEVATRLWADDAVMIQIQADEPLPSIAPQTKHAALFIAQEALTNAARHANCKAVSVIIKAMPPLLHLSVEDDGRYMEPRGTSQGTHGLATMAERATACGGKASVQRTEAGGTRVEASLPLA
jgi:signal transduction histidine kinase